MILEAGPVEGCAIVLWFCGVDGRGLTPEQLYFVSYGQTWCTKSDQEYLLMLNAQDEHSLPRERVNGPLTNSVDFHTAFSCKLGTPMNPAPETKQCRMW